jgi:hypothetical protein
MVAQVFVNQRQVANAMGVRHCVVRCCEGDVGRLLLAVGDLEQWSGVEWSGDFDDGWLARWLVLRQSSFALSQPCKEIYRYNKVTQPAEVTSFYTPTPSHRRPFAALRTPFITFVGTLGPLARSVSAYHPSQDI